MGDKTNNKNIIINQLKQSSKNEEFMFIKENNEDSNDNGINKNNLGEKNSNFSSNNYHFGNKSIFKKKRKNNPPINIIDEDSNNNIKYIYENNSISYYSKKNKNTNINCSNNNNKSIINESNNMSNFILLQKKENKNLTDINTWQNEKEEKSKSLHNFGVNNINNYNGFKPKFIMHLNNIQGISGKKVKLSNPNNIKLNNFIKKPAHKYFLLYRNPLKIMKKCFICDSFDKTLFSTEKCYHLFCKVCGKIYYEQQINNCVYSLKCPKYSCHKSLNENVLKQILSKYIYEKMMDNKDMYSQTFDKNIGNTYQNINSSRERSAKRNSIFSNDDSSLKDNKTFIYNLTYQKEFAFNIDRISSKKISQKDLLLKKLTNKFYKNSDKDLVNEHVLKIGGSSKFNRAVKKVNELKNTFCSKCNKSALFSVKNKPFIKCLNCGFTFCKFCYKKYDYYHFIRNNAFACRVFFRSHFLGKNNNYIYLHQFLYFLGGFIILFIGFIRIEVEYLK